MLSETGEDMDQRNGPAQSEQPSPELLATYFREMGASPLIDRNRELELGRELDEARKGLAKVILKLPSACREHVRGDGLDHPKRGQQWPLEKLEAFYARLLRYQREHETDAKVATLVREAKGFKRHIDHARDALILANLRLVIHLAKKYTNNGISFMDLVQEGNIGLIRAVEKFNCELGHKFSTYAYWWIKQALDRGIADKARTIRLPVQLNDKLKKVARVAQDLAQTLGREATSSEIARKLRMPVQRVEEVLNVVQQPLAFEDFSPDDRHSPLLLVADPGVTGPLQHTEGQELREKTAQLLKMLTPREEKIIRWRFGIGEDRARTLDQISRILCLSRERVRQIEAIALRKILASQESRFLYVLVG